MQGAFALAAAKSPLILAAAGMLLSLYDRPAWLVHAESHAH